MALYSWDFEERLGMLKVIYEAMAIIGDEMPKFTLKKERHLKLISNNIRSSLKRKE